MCWISFFALLSDPFYSGGAGLTKSSPLLPFFVLRKAYADYSWNRDGFFAISTFIFYF